MLRRIITFALIAAVAVPLGACGRRGSLEAQEGSTYPRAYPADYNAPQDRDDNNKNK